MKKIIILYSLTFLQLAGYSQVPNDDCATAFDFGVFPFAAGPSCPNGGAPYVGYDDDLGNVTPSSPFYSMTGCQGYTSATTTLADDIWYKYRGLPNATKVWMAGNDTLHVNFYYGTGCGTLQPSACFTYVPSYFDTIFTIYSSNDTANYYNYIQISSNVPGKQFWYFVCIDQPTFTIPPPTYGTIQINNNVSIEEAFQNMLVSVFPNPVTNKLNITTNSKEKAEIILSDIASRKIHRETFTTSLSLNTEQLEKGIYLYEVRNKNGVIKKGKVVKE